MEHPSYNIPTRNRAIRPAESSPARFRSAAAIMTTSELKSYFPDNVIAITGFLLKVLQDAVIELIQAGRCTFASGTALTVTPEILDQITGNIAFFRRHLILRPQEISNNPEIIRRLGIISINTALEVDLFGNVNSTHLMGTQLMNGIGGSGDFTRNAYISIFTCPSVQKNGKISTIVPLVTHMDHSEHSVQVVVTEWGVADLRGKDERERAQLIINHCAHPDYRDELQSFVNTAKEGYSPESLANTVAMHVQFLKTGDMRGTQWN